MDTWTDEEIAALAAELRARGWDHAALTALEAFAPLLPLGAQVLWIAQPALGMIGGGRRAGVWARILESPEGVAALQARLTDEL
jgi:hypothetical protein